jgi:hypothetical protein
MLMMECFGFCLTFFVRSVLKGKVMGGESVAWPNQRHGLQDDLTVILLTRLGSFWGSLIQHVSVSVYTGYVTTSQRQILFNEKMTFRET